jgi:hypothetical protein
MVVGAPHASGPQPEGKRRQRAARPDAPRAPRNVVVALPTASRQAQVAPAMGPGPAESAVLAECAPFAESHQIIVAQARAIAAKIDDPQHGGNIARNSNELDKLRAELRGPKRKMGARGNRLTTISAMSRRAAQ